MIDIHHSIKCIVKKRDLLYKTDAFLSWVYVSMLLLTSLSVLTYLSSQSVHPHLPQFLNTYLIFTVHIYLYVYLILFNHWWISFQQSLHIFISFPVWNLYLSMKTSFHKTIHEFYFAQLHPFYPFFYFDFFSELIQFF